MHFDICDTRNLIENLVENLIENLIENLTENLIEQERVMTKSAEYGTAFLYGTAP